MKKPLLILSAMCGLSYGTAIAQTNSIPNGNFESWTSSTYEIPQNYVQSSNTEALNKNMLFNCVKSADAYHGNYAVQMTTEISATHDTVFGYLLNTNPGDGNGPSSWHGGFPYSEKPSGMRGYYQSSIASPDSGIVAAFFYKAGVMIGQYAILLSGTHTDTYILFSIPFIPALAQNPDTVIFVAASSNFGNQKSARNGSMLKLDSISFTGVTSQPALFNGDFETWQSTTLDKPNNWYLNGGGNNATGGVSKTTDIAGGNGSYAVELKTYLGDNKGVPRAQGAQVSTGWYPNNCNSNCQEQGGYPYTKQIDTLVFSYKYAPIDNDSASVSLNFKKNGVQIGGGQGIFLHSSANYQYKEIPFNLGQVPDSVMVGIQSSNWNDTLPSFVGSDLKIDNIHFKSQAALLTGIAQNNSNDNDVQFYPNPIKTFGIIEINPQINIQGTELRMYDVFGRTIEKIVVTEHKMILDRNDLSDGIYFYELKTNNIMLKAGKIIVE